MRPAAAALASAATDLNASSSASRAATAARSRAISAPAALSLADAEPRSWLSCASSASTAAHAWLSCRDRRPVSCCPAASTESTRACSAATSRSRAACSSASCPMSADTSCWRDSAALAAATRAPSTSRCLAATASLSSTRRWATSAVRAAAASAAARLRVSTSSCLAASWSVSAWNMAAATPFSGCSPPCVLPLLAAVSEAVAALPLLLGEASCRPEEVSAVVAAATAAAAVASALASAVRSALSSACLAPSAACSASTSSSSAASASADCASCARSESISLARASVASASAPCAASTCASSAARRDAAATLAPAAAAPALPLPFAAAPAAPCASSEPGTAREVRKDTTCSSDCSGATATPLLLPLAAALAASLSRSVAEGPWRAPAAAAVLLWWCSTPAVGPVVRSSGSGRSRGMTTAGVWPGGACVERAAAPQYIMNAASPHAPSGTALDTSSPGLSRLLGPSSHLYACPSHSTSLASTSLSAGSATPAACHVWPGPQRRRSPLVGSQLPSVGAPPTSSSCCPGCVARCGTVKRHGTVRGAKSSESVAEPAGGGSTCGRNSSCGKVGSPQCATTMNSPPSMTGDAVAPPRLPLPWWCPWAVAGAAGLLLLPWCSELATAAAWPLLLAVVGEEGACMWPLWWPLDSEVPAAAAAAAADDPLAPGPARRMLCSSEVGGSGRRMTRLGPASHCLGVLPSITTSLACTGNPMGSSTRPRHMPLSSHASRRPCAGSQHPSAGTLPTSTTWWPRADGSALGDSGPEDSSELEPPLEPLGEDARLVPEAPPEPRASMLAAPGTLPAALGPAHSPGCTNTGITMWVCAMTRPGGCMAAPAPASRPPRSADARGDPLASMPGAGPHCSTSGSAGEGASVLPQSHTTSTVGAPAAAAAAASRAALPEAVLSVAALLRRVVVACAMTEMLAADCWERARGRSTTSSLLPPGSQL
mmetsp:Transcript_22818/g.58075  ORF Transcript_22818/g.58075 Transcript_22818/m.58075 type:complete len:946 (+) Transcript_22818:810-3647(+)